MAVDTRSTEANKALVRRAIRCIHGADDEPSAIFSPDFVAYMPGRPPLDRSAFQQFLTGFGAGFPGYTVAIHDQIAQGDTVFNRMTGRGIHGGEFAGVPASGRPIEIRVINMFKVKGDRVVELRAELDIFGLLQQIGAIPAA